MSTGRDARWLRIAIGTPADIRTALVPYPEGAGAVRFSSKLPSVGGLCRCARQRAADHERTGPSPYAGHGVRQGHRQPAHSFAADAGTAGLGVPGGEAEGRQRVQAAGSQRLVLRLLKPENLMNESTSRDLEGMHVFAVQEPEIEGRQSGQGYQDNPEH